MDNPNKPNRASCRQDCQHCQLLEEACKCMEQQVNFYKTLCEEQKESSSLNYKESYYKLQEEYSHLEKKHNELLKEINEDEMKHNQIMSDKNTSFEKKENALKKEHDMLIQKYTAEINNEKLYHQKQFNQNDILLKQLMATNVQLKCELAELQTNTPAENSGTTSDKEEIDCRNILIHREAQLENLNKELKDADLELIALSANMADDSLRQPNVQHFEYAQNTLADFNTPSDNKGFNEDWDAEDYQKYQGLYLHKTNNRSTSATVATCSYSEDSERPSTSKCYITPKATKTNPINSDHSQPSTASKSKKITKRKKSKQDGGENTKTDASSSPLRKNNPKSKRKLLNESMQNAFDHDLFHD